MRNAIRMGALMNIPAVYVFTHDSIGLGEDGPTHQPIEHATVLSAIPNLTVFRPADANESAAAWATAMTLKGPACLIFTRQDLPVLTGDHVRPGVARGGYVLAESGGKPQVILISRGSEVHLAMEAFEQLKAEGVAVRVVSIPSWNLFDQQDAAYKAAVLPPDVTRRVSIEAGITMGWDRYVGSQGVTIGIDPATGPAPPSSASTRNWGSPQPRWWRRRSTCWASASYNRGMPFGSGWHPRPPHHPFESLDSTSG